MYDIKYVDGKPVKVEIDEVEELKNELHKDNEPENAFDIEKRALYANTPKAKAKMDRSITARSLSEASIKLKSLLSIAKENAQYHDELNPKLWTEDKQLKPEVAKKLKEIARAFIEFLDINTDAIKDIVITGSSASYNYTPLSDIDLHLKVDYDKVHEDCPIVEGFLWSMKAQFNKDHDISIYGIPVELYAEPLDQGTVHNGLYSLTQNKWIDEPKKIVPPDNDAAVQAKYEELKEASEKIEDSEVASEILNKIYEMRKAGLASAGEFSTENLAFKKLRDNGIIEKLKQMKKEKIDKELSLENKLESLLKVAYESNKVYVRNKRSGNIYEVTEVDPEIHEVLSGEDIDADKNYMTSLKSHSLKDWLEVEITATQNKIKDMNFEIKEISAVYTGNSKDTSSRYFNLSKKQLYNLKEKAKEKRDIEQKYLDTLKNKLKELQNKETHNDEI